MGLEQVRGPFWERRHLGAAPIRWLLSRIADCVSVTGDQGVCDEKGGSARREVVRSRLPACLPRDGIASHPSPGDRYTAACSGSLSADRASLGIGMLTITEVPEPLDSIFISPWN